jgi:ribosome-binding protein aMBF1 (putative translation factor)
MTGRPRNSHNRYGHARRVDVEVKRTARWRELARLIGLRIRYEREKRDIAASELAAAIGSCVRVIHRWESGTNPPHLSSLFAIATALGCDIIDLVPRSNEYLVERYA